MRLSDETGFALGLKMKWKAAAILMLCTATLLQGRQDDSLSAFEKCRIVTTGDLTDKQVPSFATYQVSSAETRESATLDLKSNPIARTYRTVLKGEMAEGPNFAGHNRVAVWGCGSSCAMFAVVNLKTGRHPRDSHPLAVCISV